MRRWNRPIHDFLAPDVRGAVVRVTVADTDHHPTEPDNNTSPGGAPAPASETTDFEGACHFFIPAGQRRWVLWPDIANRGCIGNPSASPVVDDQ